jgi:hypothetical protein
MVEEHLNELTDLVGRPRGPFVVTQVERILLIGQHSLPIRLNEVTQDEAFGGEEQSFRRYHWNRTKQIGVFFSE